MKDQIIKAIVDELNRQAEEARCATPYVGPYPDDKRARYIVIDGMVDIQALALVVELTAINCIIDKFKALYPAVSDLVEMGKAWETQNKLYTTDMSATEAWVAAKMAKDEEV